MKRHFALLVLFSLIALKNFSQTTAQAGTREPLSLPDVVAYLAGAMQDPTLVGLIVQRGIGFEMTDAVEAGLKDCGAREESLQAIRQKPGKTHPDWLPAYSEICRALPAVDFESGKKAFAGLSKKPAQAAALFLMARWMHDDEQSAPAMELAQRAAELDPENVENQTFLAVNLLEAHLVDRALPIAKAALAKAPNLGEAHRVFGKILLAQGDSVGALREYKEAIRLAPYSSRSYLNLTDASEKANDIAGMEQGYQGAIQVNPRSFFAHYDYGIFLAEKKNDLMAAIGHYQEALAINPTEPRALNNLGATSCDAGHHDLAVKAYGKLFELYPDWGIGRACYAKSLYYEGQYVESVKQAQIGARDDPGSMVFERYLGLSYLRLGNIDEGTALIMQVLAKRPQSAEAHLDAARALRLSNREDEAIKQYREAERLNPEDSPTVLELAGILTSKGKTEEGLLEYEKAIPLMDSEQYTQWVHGLRQREEEKKLALNHPPAAVSDDAGPMPASPDGGFLHQHSYGDVQAIVDRVLAARPSEVENWKRDPSLMGKSFTDLCTPYDKSLVQDLLLGAATRFRDRATSAGITEMTWATHQLMMARNTDRQNLHELLDRVVQFHKTNPPDIPGVGQQLDDGIISLQQHMLDAPAVGKMHLPPNWIACHLRTHPAPQFNRGQELELASRRIQVAATIGPDGSVTQAKAVSKASDTLAKIATDTVMRYKYDPIYVAGHAWEVDTVVDVDFK